MKVTEATAANVTTATIYGGDGCGSRRQRGELKGERNRAEAHLGAYEKLGEGLGAAGEVNRRDGAPVADGEDVVDPGMVVVSGS
jgi:hypothetical protein